VDAVCPACGFGTVSEESLSGFCAQCDEKRHVAEYQDKHAVAIETRKTAWRNRTPPSTSKAAATARQRRHRLLVALTPTEPPPANADPWELANEAIIALNLLRSGVAHSEVLTMKLELVAERVRWLAIGPQD
jgi:uncharacterized Zn finger protein (UPF0148 family)